ncbi:MAG: hypothetical protein K6U74_17415 [Firmicutes bacterium]|nr:hypothetical protein [Bacillota bacterium]
MEYKLIKTFPYGLGDWVIERIGRRYFMTWRDPRGEDYWMSYSILKSDVETLKDAQDCLKLLRWLLMQPHINAFARHLSYRG